MNRRRFLLAILLLIPGLSRIAPAAQKGERAGPSHWRLQPGAWDSTGELHQDQSSSLRQIRLTFTHLASHNESARARQAPTRESPCRFQSSFLRVLLTT